MLIFLQSNVLAKVIAFSLLINIYDIKSGGKSKLSLSFLAPTVNDATRKLFMVGIHSTVEKRAKRTPDIIVETTNTRNYEFHKEKKIGSYVLVPRD